MQDLRIQFGAERPDVERTDKTPVVDARQSRERRELAFGCECEEAVRPDGERSAQPRDVGDPPTFHVWRCYDDLGRRVTDSAEQTLDVLGSVAEIDVEGDDVIATAAAEAEFKRLPEAEVRRVVEDAHFAMR